ncbi:hypothetical protein [Lacinutrix salivirga]
MRLQNYSKYIALSLVLLFINTSCKENDDTMPLAPSSIGEIDYVTVLGGSKNESAQSVKKTIDGGYIILGFTQSNDQDITDKQDESYDYWILKFNAQNQLEWSKTYGGSQNDRGNEIIQTQDGGYAIVGYSNSNNGDVTENAGSLDYWVAKLDPSGNITWQKSFGYSGADSGTTIIQTNDNGYLISGVLDVSASGGEGNTRNAQARHAGGDYWTIKLDSSGALEWSKYYGGSFTDTPYGVVQTEDNGFIMVGSSDSADVDITNNKGSYDFWVIKISNTGEILWEKNYGGSEIDEARNITATTDGNYIIAGDTRSNTTDVSSNNGAADLWLVKINPLGEIIWEQNYGGTGFDVARDIKNTQDGGFIISGSSRSADGDVTENKGQNDAWIIKVNSSGSLLWQQSVGGSDIDFSYGVAELNDGSVVAVGESNSNDGDILENKGFTDLLLIKIK